MIIILGSHASTIVENNSSSGAESENSESSSYCRLRHNLGCNLKDNSIEKSTIINASWESKSSDVNQAIVKSLHPLAVKIETYLIRDSKAFLISVGTSLIKFHTRLEQFSQILEIKAYHKNVLIKELKIESTNLSLIRIGRSKDCEIAITKDLELSKIHCTIFFDNVCDCWKIIDGNMITKSSNGLWMMIIDQEIEIKCNETELKWKDLTFTLRQ